MPDGEVIEFVDRNLGPQRFVAGVDFGDFVVWRRDGGPSYQLACVVDDAAMRITEVVRGADLLKSTARQILLNRALGFDNPAWYHCRLVVDHNGRRLAKRHDALSLRALRQRGLTPMNILGGRAAGRSLKHSLRGLAPQNTQGAKAPHSLCAGCGLGSRALVTQLPTTEFLSGQ